MCTAGELEVMAVKRKTCEEYYMWMARQHKAMKKMAGITKAPTK